MLKNIKNLFPIFKWNKSYNKHFLILDAIAGIIAGAIIVPETIVYSSLAGLPPQRGLYIAFAALLVYLYLVLLINFQ